MQKGLGVRVSKSWTEDRASTYFDGEEGDLSIRNKSSLAEANEKVRELQEFDSKIVELRIDSFLGQLEDGCHVFTSNEFKVHNWPLQLSVELSP